MALATVSLDDKYDLSQGRVLPSGTQAVVRLMLMQQARDARPGKRTAGYVTGYRGSPLGGIDRQFWRAADALRPPTSSFRPGSTRTSPPPPCGGPSRPRCAFDPFGYSTERRLERRLLADYEETIESIADRLSLDNHALAVALAGYPEKIRGFGHVKADSAAQAVAEAAIRREAFINGQPKAEAAE